MRPQRRRIGHAPIAGRHHIGHQPLVAGRILARDHRRLRHRRHAAPAPPRSRPARSGSRAASPARRRARGTPAPRPHASAPGPRCGTSGSPQAQTGPPRTAPPSARHAPDSRAPSPPPQCKARPLPQQAQAASPRPRRKPGVRRSDGRSGRCRSLAVQRNMPGRIVLRLRSDRTVDQAGSWDTASRDAASRSRTERLAAEVTRSQSAASRASSRELARTASRPATGTVIRRGHVRARDELTR